MTHNLCLFLKYVIISSTKIDKMPRRKDTDTKFFSTAVLLFAGKAREGNSGRVVEREGVEMNTKTTNRKILLTSDVVCAREKTK